MERYSMSLVTKETRAKPQRETHTATILAKFLTFNSVRCWQECGATGIVINSGCEYKWVQPQLALFRKIEDLHIHDLLIPLQGVALEKPTHMCTRSMYRNSQFYNSPQTAPLVPSGGVCWGGR